jgi:flagellar brake protein
MTPACCCRTLASSSTADTKLDVNLRLQHVTSLNAEARSVRLGLEFVRPGGDALRALQRFIDLTQKRRKLMALN